MKGNPNASSQPQPGKPRTRSVAKAEAEARAQEAQAPLTVPESQPEGIGRNTSTIGTSTGPVAPTSVTPSPTPAPSSLPPLPLHRPGDSDSDDANEGNASDSSSVPSSSPSPEPNTNDQLQHEPQESESDLIRDSRTFFHPDRNQALSPREWQALHPDRYLVLGQDPENYRSLDSVARMILDGQIKKIVVAAGAGISTAAGIPDFRTPGTGLYDNLQKYNLPEPEDIFCLEYFEENPKPFFHLAKELYPGNFKPTRTHFFLTLLSRRSLLHTLLTQNIDTLETLAGVPTSKVIHAHGSFASASCTSCRAPHAPDHVRRAIFASLIPECTQCAGGVVKPDIVFFGESLPSAFFTAMQRDVPEADLLLVLGTSLKVAPFNMVIDEVGVRVPRVLINRERVGESKHPGRGFDFDGKYQKFRRDVFVGDACDDAIERLVQRLGWEKELDELEKEWELAAALDKVKL